MTDPDTSPVARRKSLMPIVDPATHEEFVDLMGESKAKFWLQEFRDDLIANLGSATARTQDAQPSRDKIHHLYGRAGFMGFIAFREACGVCLELGPDDDRRNAAYLHLRHEAERACKEIEQRTDAQT